MNLGDINLLSLILFSPAVVALILVLLPSKEKPLLRWGALLGSLIPLGLSILLWFSFDKSVGGFQFVEEFAWYPALNSTYHVGVDGLSLTMVLLTTLLTPL